MGGRPRSGFRIICRERREHRDVLGPGIGIATRVYPGKG